MKFNSKLVFSFFHFQFLQMLQAKSFPFLNFLNEFFLDFGKVDKKCVGKNKETQMMIRLKIRL